jgi:hypothetical protein
MKIKNLMPVMALMLLLLLISGCERKVVNETAGDQTAQVSCFTCHNDNDVFLVERRQEYDLSQHAVGETVYRNRNNSSFYQSCERCHTNEGYVARLTGVAYTGDHFSKIACFTCHAPHTNGSLELRADQYNMLVTLGNGNQYDMGEGNTCGQCHISRRYAAEYVAETDTLSTHFGPHHGPQSDMLVGDNAYEYSGYTAGYPDSYHPSGLTDFCVQCHMAKPIFGAGGHTFAVEGENGGEEYDNVYGCNVDGCHSGNPLSDFDRTAYADFDWDGDIESVPDEVEGLLDSLQGLLYADGLLEWVHEGDDSLLEPKDERPVTSADTTGALYNYLFVHEDRSMGIHNTKYAVALLQSSVNFLSSGDPNGGPVINSDSPNIMAAH